MRPVSVLLVICFVLTSAVAFAGKPPSKKPLNFSRGLLDCSSATPIGCPWNGTGSTIGGVGTVDYYSCTSWTETGPEAVYELTLVGPDCYIVTGTISGMSADLDIFFLTACDEGMCQASGNTSFTSNCLEPGTYYIVVDGYYGAQDDFMLDVTCEVCECPGGIENDDCATAIEVFDGSFVTGSTMGAMNDYDPDCAPYNAAGPDVVYYIDLLPGDELTVTMNADYDAVLYAVLDCDMALCCAADDAYPYPETDVITCCAENGGRYYVFADGYGSAAGSFDVTVSVGECEGPDPELCNFPTHETCDDAVVFCGDVLVHCKDTNYLAANDYSPGSGGCTGYSADGGDVVYRVTLLPGASIDASMDPIDYFDASIYLITDCADPVGSCVAGDDSGNPEAVSYVSAGGGAYYLICDNYSSYSDGGLFWLDITVMGGGPSAVEETTWGSVKAMYR